MINFRMDKEQYSLETENLVDLADIYIDRSNVFRLILIELKNRLNVLR